ncbi:conserved hypothetical protein [Ketogulonicigenium vulgare Y25]|uniref:phage tail protein n=1 Tax=Ketogulonicigenium vulgare TaxID=92945 RepID=UPI0001E66B37|nr:phage tail protein [Ketogulonicigenium vulgare]ADO42382.1 conserved hypothetical protein [Ketogulonicigenium vulgare Y25]
MSKAAKKIIGVAAGGRIIGVAAVIGLAFIPGMQGAAASAWTWATTTVTGKLMSSVALTALGQVLAGKQSAGASSGIKNEVTLTGGTVSQGFILGRYATGGSHVCPPMTHGRAGGAQNAYLTYVIAASDVPGCSLDGILVDGKLAEITTTNHATYGQMVKFDDRSDRAWVRWHDGHQTAADSHLLAAYGNRKERPWTADMIGHGTAYAVVTFQYDTEAFKGMPQVQLVVGGIPLYDPRFDSSIGGAGAMRWHDRSTWAASENPAVQAYNILRGITLPDGRIWGGQADSAQLPLTSWVAAMNAADAQVATTGGGSEPAWRTSYEVALSDEPATVLEQLGAASLMQFAEVGTAWLTRLGGPAAPVAWISDDDIVVTEGRSFEVIKSMAEVYNGVAVAFPDPASNWQSVPAPIYRNPAHIAADDGQENIADLQLGAAPYAEQVQRLAVAYAEDSRRSRVFTITLPPEYAYLTPLDTISWSSQENGFDGKVFEVAGKTVSPFTQLVTFSLREVDPNDYQPDLDKVVPWVPVSQQPEALEALMLSGVNAYGLILEDNAGAPRRPAIRAVWQGDGLFGVTGIAYEVAATGSNAVLTGMMADPAAGGLTIADGILPATSYQIRLRPIAEGLPVVWSGWVSVTTPDVRLTADELSAEIRASLATLDAWIAADLGDLPGIVIALEEVQDALISSVQDIEGQQAATSGAVAGLSTRVADAEGRLATQAEALTSLNSSVSDLALAQAGTATAVSSLTTRVSDAEGNLTALSDSLTSVSAQVGDMSAEGRFRVTVVAEEAGASTTIGLNARVMGGGAQDSQAALYLRARSGAPSEVIIDAQRFAVTGGQSDVYPFIIDNGRVYMRGAMIEADSLTLPLFANGVLQTALYPVRVDIFMSSVSNWQPPMEGLAAAYVIGGGGGGGAVYQGYYNNQAAQGYRPMFAGGGGSGGFGWNFIPNLNFSQRYNIFVGAGGGGGWVSGGAQEGWGWDGGASHFYNLNAGGWSESQIINVWAAGGQSGWVGSREATPNRWSPPRQSGHATGGRWNSPGYGNTHDMSVHIGAGGSSADFGLGVDRWGNPFGEGQQGGMREAWPAIFNGLEVTGLPFKGLYGNDFRGGAGNVHGWEGNGGYGGGGAGRSTHDYRGDDGGTNGSRDVAGGSGGQGFVMVVYYGQGNLK